MDTQHYELLYIIPLLVTTDETSVATIEHVAKILKDEGAEITKDDNLGKMKLAYPIKHIASGEYILVEFDAQTEKIKNIDRELRLFPGVLRHLIIKKDPKLAAKEETRKKERVLKEIEKSEEAEKAQPEEKKEPEERGKVNLEDLDKKLNEILEDNII